MEHEAQRELEKRALRNTRALIDKLEVQEISAGSRRRLLAALAVAPVLFLGAAWVIHARVQPSEDAANQGRACVLDAWNARAAAFVAEARKAHPEDTAPEIQDRLRAAQPALMAEAKASCERAPRR